MYLECSSGDEHTQLLIRAMKKRKGLLRGFVGDFLVPSYIGSIISHYFAWRCFQLLFFHVFPDLGEMIQFY